MLGDEIELKRQENVVKKFRADHPEYDPANSEQNKCLVDIIENSKRPFTTETIEWAYKELIFYNSWIEAFKNGPINFEPVSPPAFYGNSIASMGTSGTSFTLPEGYNETVKQVDVKPAKQYDKDILPTSTVRRIKEYD